MTEQSSAALVRVVQTALAKAGYDPHGVDGVAGRYTWAAIFSYVSGAKLGDVGLALADGALAAFPRFGIAFGRQSMHLIGQAAAETSGFRTFVENLNYSAAGLAQYFPTRGYSTTGKSTGDPTALARAHARNPQMIANHVYGGRNGNGPEASGDGWRHRGRGPTMLTFRSNYLSVGQAIGVDLVAAPDKAADPTTGMLIMARYWQVKGLNPYADAGNALAVSRGINLGNPLSTSTPNGLSDRVAYTKSAVGLLS